MTGGGIGVLTLTGPDVERVSTESQGNTPVSLTNRMPACGGPPDNGTIKDPTLIGSQLTRYDEVEKCDKVNKI